MSGTPQAQWREEPGSGVALPLGRLVLLFDDDGVAHLEPAPATPDGYFVDDGTGVFTATEGAPSGASIALRDGASYFYA